MGIHHTRRRDYRGQAQDGNVYTWIIEETERIRHHDHRKRDEAWEASRPKPVVMASLRLHPHGTPRALLDAYESSPNAPGENAFEVSKARKL